MRATTSPFTTAVLMLLFVILATSFLQGCTGIGYLVGRDADRKQASLPKEGRVVAPDSIREGRLVTLLLKDSSVVEGKSEGLIELPDSIYIREYESALDTMPAHTLPKLAENVTVGFPSGGATRIEFAGFHPRAYLFVDTNEHRVNELLPKRVASLSDSAGVRYDCDALTMMLNCRMLPVKSALRLTSMSQRKMLSLNSILQAKEYPSAFQKNRWIGMGIGLAIDALVVWQLAETGFFDLDLNYGGSYSSQ